MIPYLAVSKTPKSAILSTRSASIPVEAFEAIGDDVDQSLNLSLALLHEQRLGQASHFYGYIQSLPPLGVPLPIFWKQDSLEWKWLEGTECHRRLTRAGQGLMGGMTFVSFGRLDTFDFARIALLIRSALLAYRTTSENT